MAHSNHQLHYIMLHSDKWLHLRNHFLENLKHIAMHVVLRRFLQDFPVILKHSLQNYWKNFPRYWQQCVDHEHMIVFLSWCIIRAPWSEPFSSKAYSIFCNKWFKRTGRWCLGSQSVVDLSRKRTVHAFSIIFLNVYTSVKLHHAKAD